MINVCKLYCPFPSYRHKTSGTSRIPVKNASTTFALLIQLDFRYGSSVVYHMCLLMKVIVNRSEVCVLGNRCQEKSIFRLRKSAVRSMSSAEPPLIGLAALSSARTSHMSQCQLQQTRSNCSLQ